MRDIIFAAPTYAALLSEAERLGFVDEDGKFLLAGEMKSGGGWFLNLVGEIQEAPGFWGRLRVNGDEEDLPVFFQDIEQYKWADGLGGWTKDGVNLAPEFVGNIGTIA